LIREPHSGQASSFASAILRSAK